MSFELLAHEFAPGDRLPRKNTCDGEDRSPWLRWIHAPPETRSFALIMEDPDAPQGEWVHWVIYNIPTSQRALPEGIEHNAELKDGIRQGVNSWGKLGYNGPCPLRGMHRYLFHLYALDTPLTLGAYADKRQLMQAMATHILAQSELRAAYAH